MAERELTTNEIIRERIFLSSDVITKNIEHMDNLLETLTATGVLPITVQTLKQIAEKIYKENSNIGLSAAAMEVK